MNKEFTCCICGKKVNEFGNSPAGAAWKNDAGQIIIPTYDYTERCCTECNTRYVIPGRLYQMGLARGNK